jgi:hypothetical protein
LQPWRLRIEVEPRESLALAGICLGLVFLGKAELFVPAAGTAAFGLTAIVVTQRASHALRSIAIFVGASVAPVFIAGALLLAIMPAAVAWRGLLGNWSHMGTSLVDDAFYLTGSGFNAPAANLRAALLSFVALVLFAATVALTDRLLPAVRRRRWLCIGVATVGIGLVAWARVRFPFDEVARALPITSALLGLALWLPAVRRRMGLWRDAESWLPLALLSVYATTLLGKMLLNAQIPHYGFVLAMPSALLLITSLCWLLPRSLERGYGGGGLARALCVATVICAALFFLRSSQFHYRQRTFELGRNGDIIKVEARRYSIRGYVLDETMARLEEIMDPDDTLLVLPEGASLNYWLRRTNPTPYSLFLPTEFAAFDKRGKMLRSLEEHPPDFVVLLHRENSEFGVGPFGQDPANGLAMMQWISRRYEFVVRVGAAPFSGNGFGSVILKRRSIPRAQSRTQIP